MQKRSETTHATMNNMVHTEACFLYFLPLILPPWTPWKHWLRCWKTNLTCHCWCSIQTPSPLRCRSHANCSTAWNEASSPQKCWWDHQNSHTCYIEIQVPLIVLTIVVDAGGSKRTPEKWTPEMKTPEKKTPEKQIGLNEHNFQNDPGSSFNSFRCHTYLS